ncbi:MAG: Adaptive-response sensory-kinase SasA [Myxococcota bacterium]|nr:Adaptive-response sensory-kinase SasA [Myxococcota bacterium]
MMDENQSQTGESRPQTGTGLPEATKSFYRETLAQLMDHADLLVCMIDINRRVTMFNRSFERLTGYPRSGVIGTDFLQWIQPGERDKYLHAMRESVAGRNISRLEAQIKCADGNIARVVINTATVPGEDDTPSSVLVIGQDITELKTLEAQVLQTERLASLGELAANVVHEINNPLTIIESYSTYLLGKLKSGDSIDESSIERMEHIVEAAHRVRRFTRDLISYARQPDDEFAAVDVRQLIMDSLSFCAPLLADTRIQVRRSIPRDLPRIHAIKGQLEQVLVNLFTNAIHAMGMDGVLDVKIEAANGMMSFVVSDTGPGIPPEHVSRIFKPFFTTKPKGKGTGLGLSIVARIVENHKGRITVESAVGAGATFQMTIPISKPPGAASSPPPEPEQ